MPGTQGEVPRLFDPAAPQAFKHLRPVRFRRVGTASTTFVVEIAPYDVIDDYTASMGVLAPDCHAFAQRLKLPGIEVTWELHAQLLEQL